MAILFVDSFDHYVTADYTKKWTSTSAVPTISAANGRRGTAAALLTSDGLLKAFGANKATVILGAALKFTSPLANGQFFYTVETNSTQVVLQINIDGSISAYRGAVVTLLGTTVSGVITADAYHYVELKVLHSNTVGTLQIWVDGISVLSLTGQDTCATANEYATAAGFSAGGTTFYVDDFYIDDANRLGDVRIDCLFPNANGTNNAWTLSAGTDAFALVDEAAPNTTDYLYSSTLNQITTVNMQDLGAVTGTIFGCAVNNTVLKDDAGARSIGAVVVSGAATSVVGSDSLTNDYITYQELYETDPNTAAAWLEAAVNAMECGVKVVV